MGILRADRVSGLGGANAINGSVKFGNGIGNYKGYDSILTEPSSDFTFGTGDFTLEGWFYLNHVMDQWVVLIADTLYASSGGWSLYTMNGTIYFWKAGSAVLTGGTLTADTWHHIAYSRESGVNRIFVDGVLANTNNSDSTDYTDNEIAIGANSVNKNGYLGSYGLSGYASNVRVTKGTALYTATFTPSTTRLEKRSDTVLLCCQSPGNAEQEATGKNVIRMGNAAASHFSPNVGEEHGTTFTDNTKFDTLSYMVPPGGKTTDRYLKSTGDIVSDNLIWHIDAGNVGSYAGVSTSGTTIYDLKAGSGMNGNVGIATLTSGHANFTPPGWTPDNGGAWYFGSDSNLASPSNIGQKIDMPYINLSNDNYTINVWVKLQYYSQQSDGYSYLISNKDSSPVSFHAHVKEVSGKGRIGAGAYYGGWNYDYAKDVDYNTVIALNQWYMLTWVNTAQYTQSMYVNGVKQRLHNANDYTWNSRTSNNTPLNSTSYANNETTNGWIGQIQYYSDTLTADEILQNYNAHKCRYDQ